MSVSTSTVHTDVKKDYFVQDASKCIVCKGNFNGANENFWATVSKEIIHDTITYNIEFTAHVECLTQIEGSLSHQFDLKDNEVIVLRAEELEELRSSEKNVFALQNTISDEINAETQKLSLIKDIYSSCVWTSVLLSIGSASLGSLNVVLYNNCQPLPIRINYLLGSIFGALSEGFLLNIKVPSYKAWVIAASSIYFACRYTIPSSPIFFYFLN